MINEIVAALRRRPRAERPASRRRSTDRRSPRAHALAGAHHHARWRTARRRRDAARGDPRARAKAATAPVLGITGTGGAGKSSLTDELVRRFRLDQGDRLRIAIISIDPSRRKTGGALLGDRIRMNATRSERTSTCARSPRASGGSEVARRCPTSIAACKAAGFDLVIVETSGIGQGDAAIVPLADVSLYVMTPEFGAAIAAREDRHARLRRLRGDQQVRPQGRGRTRCATCASRCSATASASARRPRRCRCSAPSRRASTTTASPRSTSALAAALAAKGLPLEPGTLRDAGVRHSDRPARHRAAAARALPRRDRGGRARLPRAGPRTRPAWRGSASSSPPRRRCWKRSARRTARRWSR